MSRVRRFAALGLAAGATLAVTIGTAAAEPSPVDTIIGSQPAAPALPGNDFYLPPAQLPDGEPGDVIRARTVSVPTSPT